MKFFKFTLSKFLIACILFAATAAVSPILYRYLVLDAHLRGLPLPFAFMKNTCYMGVAECVADFFWISFVLDLLFWYFISSVFAWLGELIKKG